MSLTYEPALPVGSTILVTGANSFIGANICNELLTLGYRVLGTVRSIPRCQWLLSRFHASYPESHFSLIEIQDLGAPHAFDTILKDHNISGIAHVATEAFSDPNATPNEAIAAVTRSALSLLKSALTAPNVKRFVFTSSSAAVHTPSATAVVPTTITSATWNISAVLQAFAPTPHPPSQPAMVYSACKVSAENALWTTIHQPLPSGENPGVVLNVVCPDTTVGPVLNTAPDGATSTSKFLRDCWEAGNVDGLEFPRIGGYRWLVDVRDIARLHIAGLIDPEVKGERLLGYAERYDGQRVLDIMRKLAVEEGKGRVIVEKDERPWGIVDEVDNRRSVEILKRMGREGFGATEEAIRACLGL